MKDSPKKSSGLAILIGMKNKKPEDDEMGEQMPDDEMAEGEEESPQEEEAEGETHEGMPVIRVPDSFQPPEDKQMGQEFTGTFRGYMMKDGKLCVTALNEIPMDGSQSGSEESEDQGDGETDNSTEKAAAAPSNAQNEGGAMGGMSRMESTPHVKESKKLKALLNGRGR